MKLIYHPKYIYSLRTKVFIPHKIRFDSERQCVLRTQPRCIPCLITNENLNSISDDKNGFTHVIWWHRNHTRLSITHAFSRWKSQDLGTDICGGCVRNRSRTNMYHIHKCTYVPHTILYVNANEELILEFDIWLFDETMETFSQDLYISITFYRQKLIDASMSFVCGLPGS